MQRQNQKRHNRKTVLQKIKQEYAVFKYGMLSGTVHEAYDSCKRICFYESLREYFLYKLQFYAKEHALQGETEGRDE